MEKILQKLWLSEQESKIYLDLLKNGSASLTEISKRVHISRPSLYNILPHLENINIVRTFVKWKRNFYRASHPDNLQKLLDNISKDFDTMIPEISKLYMPDNVRSEIQTISWENMLKTIFEDVANSLNHWDAYYRYSSRRPDFEFRWNLWKYKEIRNAKNLQRMVITSEKIEAKKKKKIEKKVVIIPKKHDLFEENITKVIYSDKIAIIDYTNYTGYIIQNPLIAKFEKSTFLLLFKMLKKHSS